MRFRWKLLFLLTLLAVLPLLATRTIAVRVSQSFLGKIVGETRQKLEADAEDRLLLLAGAYGEVIKGNAAQLVLAVEIQADAVQAALAGAGAGRGHGRGLPAGGLESGRYRRFGSEKDETDIDVAFDRQTLYPEAADGRDPHQADRRRIEALTPLYRRLRGQLDPPPAWQVTVLESGLVGVYPALGPPHGRTYGRPPWYDKALAAEGHVWVPEYRDPETGQSVIAVARRLTGPDSLPLGATALVVPMAGLLERPALVRNTPEDALTFLVVTELHPESGRQGARIAAHGNRGGGAGWEPTPGAVWLASDSSEAFDAVLSDLNVGAGGFRRMPYRGRDCIWVYSPLSFNVHLVLVIPYDTVTRHADRTQADIERLIDTAADRTRLVAVAVAAVAAILALAFSRTVTRPLQALAAGAADLAAGNYAARVEIRSADEFADLGRLFNRVGPQLEQHQATRQALLLAREIQRNLLPRSDPRVPGLDVAGESRYCDETGGDYYDYLFPGGGRIGVVVGDVADHGVSSALLMASVRASFRQRATIPGSLARMVGDVNRRICEDVGDSGAFVTLFFALIDPEKRRLEWVNAGHEPGLLIDTAGGGAQELKGGGLPLGVDEKAVFTAFDARIAPGQILVLETDGIRECRDPAGNPFGTASLVSAVEARAGKPAAAIVDGVLAEVDAFRDGGPQEDDVTLAVVKFLDPSAPSASAGPG